MADEKSAASSRGAGPADDLQHPAAAAAPADGEPVYEQPADLERMSTDSTSTQAEHDADATAAAHDANAHALRNTKSSGSIYANKPSHFRLVFSHALVTPHVVQHHYPGAGTAEDPYVVDFLEHDPRNPMHFSERKKWSLTMMVALATLAVAFVSSAYSGGTASIEAEFHPEEEVTILGISLFVLGFAIGPLLWAPFSELYGRQFLFVGTYGVLTAFNAAAAGSQNMTTLVVLRFFAGAFGSSPLTNAGGVISDMFPGRQRGVAMAIFAAAPFMGPALGPIVGGFIGETIGWRWIEGVMAIFTGVLWIAGSLLIPETYAPVILSKRAANLSKRTGKVYKSRLDTGPYARETNPAKAFKRALGRPWVLLLKEPIVLLLSIYMAILYGTLYMLFAAFPIVFQETRGWSPGIGGLSFLGVAVGFITAVGYVLWDNKRYERTEDRCIAQGEISAPPEARLPPTLIGSICLPVGMFWFAWTNYPSIHWIVCILATVPFGFGMLLVFVSIMNYLIDSYTVYAASVLAANSVLRSLFGMAFPLFTDQMYSNLGIHWASSIPAFLALACVPFPFLFYRYGAAIRGRCKFAKEAMEVLKQLRESESPEDDGSEGTAAAEDAADPSNEKALDSGKDRDVDLERGEGSPAARLGRVSTRGTSKSARTEKSAPARSLRPKQSAGHIALDRARSYQSNF